MSVETKGYGKVGKGLLQAGKHVLCEEPFAASEEEARWVLGEGREGGH